MDSQLWTTFQAWEASASSPEKSTRILDFISIASSTSEKSSAAGELISLMSKVVIQTSRDLMELHGQALITRSRMVMSSVEDSSGRRNLAQNELRRMALSGLRSRTRAIESIFGNWFITWIPRLQLALTGNWPSMPTSGLAIPIPCMTHQEDLTLFSEMLMVAMSGSRNLALDLENHC